MQISIHSDHRAEHQAAFSLLYGGAAVSAAGLSEDTAFYILQWALIRITLRNVCRSSEAFI